METKSKAEDGGFVNGKLDGQNYAIEFGYFSPNLSTKFEVVFNDDGKITVVQFE